MLYIHVGLLNDPHGTLGLMANKCRELQLDKQRRQQASFKLPAKGIWAGGTGVYGVKKFKSTIFVRLKSAPDKQLVRECV
jgi:hypothetical protein